MNNNPEFFKSVSLELKPIFTRLNVLDNSSDTLKNFPESKKRLGWVNEMKAGHARLSPETKEVEITFVRGDRFLTLAVLIHELGHLLQDELNPALNNIDQDAEWKEYTVAKERDAQSRGWERLVAYAPELLNHLEEQVKKFQEQGKLKNFKSFKEIYDCINDCSVTINATLSSLADNDNEEEYEEQEFLALKEAGVDQLFNRIESARVDDELPELEAKNFINMLVKNITEKEKLS